MSKVTKRGLVTRIYDRLEKENIHVTKQNIEKILSIEEDEIYVIIASEDKYKFSWGTIEGISKPPKKLTGKFAYERSAIQNDGYSPWKRGYPKCTFSNSAMLCEKFSASEFFYTAEQRYTSQARKFRQQNGYPELKEFNGLTEEQIQEICEKADKAVLALQSNVSKRNKEIMNQLTEVETKYKLKNLPDDYVILGASKTELYEGANVKLADAVDAYLLRNIYEDRNPARNLKQVRTAIEIAKEYGLYEKHEQELLDLEKKYYDLVVQYGLEEYDIYHFNRDKEQKGNIVKNFDGQKDDPWGVVKNQKTFRIRKEEEYRRLREITDFLGDKVPDYVQEEMNEIKDDVDGVTAYTD